MKLFHRLMRALHGTPDRGSPWYQYHNSKIKWMAVIAVIFFLCIQPVTADTPTEEDRTVEVAEMLQTATVVVQNGMHQGTGFYISPYEVVTNNHLVSSGLMWLKKADGKPCVALVEYTDPTLDLTLIRACDVGNPLKLANSVKLGQSVMTMGNPQSMEFYLSKGIVSSLRVDGYLLHDAVTDHGNSGGAVVNLSGEVVGVAAANFKENTNMSMAISVEALKSFMERKR